ncbi:MAG TPA: TIGR03066 family protein [Gemmataceae bacterium]|jgi:uncharacterized protein (TIGR03066 family)|nr:TIGR03066 family protein [Gemmataceae bacterium]
MKTTLLLAAGLAICFLGSTAQADEKDAAKLLVGKWEVTKVDENAGPPVGAIVEMTKDGKVKVNFKDKDGNEESREGTYKLDGQKITVNIKAGTDEKSHTVTIKKITSTEFVVEDDQGKSITFARKK